MHLQSFGLLHPERWAFAGYTLSALLRSRVVYLVGMRGEVVHEWRLRDRLGTLANLLPGGRLLTTGVTDEGPPIIEGKGGRFSDYDWVSADSTELGARLPTPS